MFSRRSLYFFAAAIAGVFIVSQWAMTYPSHVTIINTSGAPLRNVTLESSNQRIALGTIANGATRTATIRPGGTLEIRFDDKHWTPVDKLEPAQAVVLSVRPNGRVASGRS